MRDVCWCQCQWISKSAGVNSRNWSTNADTDVDGVNDGDNVADPSHFGDKGREPPDQSFAMVKQW